MELKELQAHVAKFRDDRNWRQFHNPKDLAQAISIETAELMEHFLWKPPEEVEEVMSNPSSRHQVEEELADIFSYLLSFTEAHGVDLEKALMAKIEKNALKYPIQVVKGKSQKYTEY